MQFNFSLNKQESILALTQATKEQRVQELSLSVTRMSLDSVCVQEGDWEKESTHAFDILMSPRPLARYKSN